MNRLRIAIDMDETICDSLSRHLDWYNRDFGRNITKQDTVGNKIYNIVPDEHMNAVKRYPTHPDFFRDLPLIDGSLEAIRTLNEIHDIFIVTAAMEYPNSFEAKYQWLKTHLYFLSDLNFVFCGFKGIIEADYLIDDTPKHLDNFSGKGLLFHAEHNINATGYQRVRNWSEVLDILKAAT